MSKDSNENQNGLRKTIDMMRWIGIVMLLIHFYYTCYDAFKNWGWTCTIGDRLLMNIDHTGLFSNFNKSKGIALLFMLLTVLGAKGRKSEKLSYKQPAWLLGIGLLIYFGSMRILQVPANNVNTLAIVYMSITSLGFILSLTGASLFSRIITQHLSREIFNTDNETFPQAEELLTNDYSINLRARYRLKNKMRDSWINFINPRRGLLIMGSPGSGKSFFIIENIIRQLIEKGFALMIYDYKYPELTALTFQYYQQHKKSYAVEPKFYFIDFKNPASSDRNNPLNPEQMTDLLDALEASKTILLSINRTWANRQGEFFVESPINFLGAVFWFLKKYKKGIYCTLPHAIELCQLEYDKLFSILNSEPDIYTLINTFISAYLSNAMETVVGQLSSVRIPLGRLSSPQLYYVLSGNDFSLDINNPEEPKIICIGNDPLKSEALAPVLSLICDRLNKVINQQDKMKCATIYDEFATLRVSSIQTVIATGRSNQIIPVIAVQDFSQLKKVYSREEAESIFNMTGNIISGQVSGETAKLLSDRFPKIMQDRQSLSIATDETSISRSKHLDASVQPATISSLSSGEFVGIVADNPDQPITQKAFHAKIIQPENKKEKTDTIVPDKTPASPADIQNNFNQIKEDIQQLYDAIIDELMNDPAKEHLIIKKN
ncbi:MAG: YWFCY domain-containing protein [Bacteroidota bacterium]